MSGAQNLADVLAATATPAADRIGTALAVIEPAASLSRRDLEQARNELEAPGMPTTPAVTARALQLLIAAFPAWRPDADYLAPLIADLAGYSARAIIDGTNAARRRYKLPPSHAQILDAVKRAADERGDLRQAIEEALSGHGARAAADVERRRREDEDAARRRDLAGQLAELGAGAPTIQDVLAAEQYLREIAPLAPGQRAALLAGMRRGLSTAAPWVADLIAAALICLDATAGELPQGLAADIVTVAAADLATARKQLAPQSRAAAPAGRTEQKMIRRLGDAIRATLSPEKLIPRGAWWQN